MRRTIWTTGLAALATAVLAAAAPALVVKPIAFTGTYTGTAVTNQTDNTVAINANGSGTGTLLGAGKITGAGTADSSVRPCVPVTGTGKMSGPGGAIIFKVIPGSAGCGDEQGQLFSITGKATILKATGKLLKRKGTLRMSGTYDRSSGAFSVKFRGSLTK
jgi:hypothetical protein